VRHQKEEYKKLAKMLLAIVRRILMTKNMSKKLINTKTHAKIND
jgi:hypothetical protein